MKKSDFYLGGHVSTRGGYKQAALRAFDMGATAFQYFPKNPRGLVTKAYDQGEAERCKVLCAEHGILSIAHSPYPTNPAIGTIKGNDLYHAMVTSLKNDLEIAEACGSAGVVVHFGHAKTEDPLTAYRNIIQFLDEVLTNWNGTAQLLIENQAGDHGPMGTTMEEIVQIRSLSRFPESIGYCMDTCHAFASGLWNGTIDDEMLQKGHDIGYWDQLAAVHVNDSKYGLRSNKDRHERVGRGKIGAEGLTWLLNLKELKGKIWVLESEKGDDGSHKDDIDRIRSWLKR
ncbi:deoxyribonuclease IV [Neobacillus mesonae]|nr:deoxyribonuclease IV [Neobacillus mesonae]